MAGAQYQRDAPRRLNLDRYTDANVSGARVGSGLYYGPFQQISSNDAMEIAKTNQIPTVTFNR